MAGSTTTSIILIGISVLLLAVIVIRPGMTVTRGGKILAFVAMLIFPMLAGGIGTAAHLENSKQTTFCLSCHIMEDYGKSLRVDDRSYVPAVHFQNKMIPSEQACFTCHTDYAMFGDVRAKLRGLKHVYVQYLGTVPQKAKLYTPYNNRECLHCHLGARSFEESPTHLQDPKTMPAVKANEMGCTTSGCHNFVHNVSGLKDSTFWKGGNNESPH